MSQSVDDDGPANKSYNSPATEQQRGKRTMSETSRPTWRCMERRRRIATFSMEHDAIVLVTWHDMARNVITNITSRQERAARHVSRKWSHKTWVAFVVTIRWHLVRPGIELIALCSAAAENRKWRHRLHCCRRHAISVCGCSDGKLKWTLSSRQTAIIITWIHNLLHDTV